MKDQTIRARIYSIYSENKDLKHYNVAFFNELFDFLDVEKYAKQSNVALFSSLFIEAEYRLEQIINGEYWQPIPRFINEHGGDSNSIRDRITDVINWKKGRMIIQDLEEKYLLGTYKPYSSDDIFK